MVRLVFLLAFGISTGLHAQNQDQVAFVPKRIPMGWRVPGLLSASATYAPGFMLNRDQTNFHLNAFAEYHLNWRVSVKSDSYWFLNSPNEKTHELQMLRSYFGMFYHFNTDPFSNWDLKLGVMPGITYSRQEEALDSFGYVQSKSFAPSVSVALGFDYYVWKYFHFFTQLSYVNSTARGLLHGSQRMDEMLISAGLGFQIPTFPQK